MKRDNTPWCPAERSDIEWLDNHLPRSSRFDDIYYSAEDGLAESRHTFLQGNGLPQRWAHHDSPVFRIAETGFGTGLNFLLTWHAWRSATARPQELHYLAVEQYPLEHAQLARALQRWPLLAEETHQLLRHYPQRVPGWHRLLLDAGRVRLDLHFGAAGDALAELASRRAPCVDAWYLDGFAPAKNPELWTAALFADMARSSRDGASLATFTAAGAVRRELAAAGFRVERVPGFGRKRQCLRGALAARPGPLPQPAAETPWDLPLTIAPRPDRVLVIGAGLAGAHTAAALARRGIRVTVLDAAAAAGGASGNRQGVLYTRLSRRHSSLVDFSLSSFLFAVRLYRDMLETGALHEGVDGALCGGFQSGVDAAELDALRAPLATLPDLAQVLEPADAARQLGIEPDSAGLWYPDSGWLSPPAVCRALLAHEAIDLMTQCGPLSLQHGDDGWLALAGRREVACGPAAVIATGTAANLQPGLEWLPLQAIRGQTTALPATPALAHLRGVFCHEGYIAPAAGGVHCIGATFDVGDHAPSPRTADHAQNLARLARALPQLRPDLDALDTAQLSGRVGWRCASPDYLPLVGPVPDAAAFRVQYDGLRRNARRPIDRRGHYEEGLYVNTAHGSRGLTSTPLAGELLASAICAEPPPLERHLCRALAPGRFLIRDLARNRPPT